MDPNLNITQLTAETESNTKLRLRNSRSVPIKQTYKSVVTNIKAQEFHAMETIQRKETNKARREASQW